MSTATVASLLRCSQARCQQLCQKQTLQQGIAFYSERFAELRETNVFREVVVEDHAAVEAAWRECELFFGEHGLICRRWSPAANQQTKLAEPFLTTKGFELRRRSALALAKWPEVASFPDVRVLPARAMRPALGETLAAEFGPEGETIAGLQTEACEERMDDASYDMFVAVAQGQAAGRGALHQVGDVGRITDLFVLPEFVSQKVGEALLAHLIKTARRLLLRTILTQVDEKQSELSSLFESSGFVRDGSVFEFDRTLPIPRG
jgi:GNAT superfamily N-acetyltransferase